MTHLVLKTHTGLVEFTKEECLEQIENWNMFCQSDNAAGWLYKKFIMGYMTERTAKKASIEVLQSGYEQTIDVRV